MSVPRPVHMQETCVMVIVHFSMFGVGMSDVPFGLALQRPSVYLMQCDAQIEAWPRNPLCMT